MTDDEVLAFIDRKLSNPATALNPAPTPKNPGLELEQAVLTDFLYQCVKAMAGELYDRPLTKMSITLEIRESLQKMGWKDPVINKAIAVMWSQAEDGRW